jgi:hypothetical protein
MEMNFVEKFETLDAPASQLVSKCPAAVKPKSPTFPVAFGFLSVIPDGNLLLFSPSHAKIQIGRPPKPAAAFRMKLYGTGTRKATYLRQKASGAHSKTSRAAQEWRDK